MKKIYVICPVRNQTSNQAIDIEEYVKTLEDKGHIVFYPKRDAPQDCPTGYKIVMSELNFIRECDEVHVFWDINSKGSHFDLGMAVALEKRVYIVHEFEKDGEGKSYVKVIHELNKGQDYYE